MNIAEPLYCDEKRDEFFKDQQDEEESGSRLLLVPSSVLTQLFVSKTNGFLIKELASIRQMQKLRNSTTTCVALKDDLNIFSFLILKTIFFNFTIKQVLLFLRFINGIIMLE